MADLVGTIDAAVDAVTRLRSFLHNSKNRQVRNSDERALIKATTQTWFRNHRPALATLQTDPSFKAADQAFASLLEWADQNTTRAKYRELLQTTKAHLVKLRSSGVLVAPSVEPARPQFQLLISDPKMLGILDRRWTETLACQRVGADLAATVMLGGLLDFWSAYFVRASAADGQLHPIEFNDKWRNFAASRCSASSGTASAMFGPEPYGLL